MIVAYSDRRGKKILFLKKSLQNLQIPNLGLLFQKKQIKILKKYRDPIVLIFFKRKPSCPLRRGPMNPKGFELLLDPKGVVFHWRRRPQPPSTVKNTNRQLGKKTKP